jgi:hypothetical protein
MAFAFDTLGYSKHLQSAGIRRGMPTHTQKLRERSELVTKADLALAIDNMKLAMDNVKSSLTIRLGSMIGAGIAALAVLQRVH